MFSIVQHGYITIGNNRSNSLPANNRYFDVVDDILFYNRLLTAQEISDIAVSSTKISKAIENGKIEKANIYIGYNFMLSGKVVNGKNLGEKIGFPTANLFIKENYKLIPKTGAYIVKSEIENSTVFGMMNIGFRPTVSGKNQTIEIHFFTFNGNLYGKKIRIEVLSFLREEQKFESVEALKQQLETDKKNSLDYINGTFFDSKEIYKEFLGNVSPNS